jgi:hypothetical protein
MIKRNNELEFIHDILLKLLNDYEEKFISLKIPDFIKNEMINMEHGEYGVVLENLCVQLYEYDIKVADDDFKLIKEVAEIIGINKDAYDFLRPL